MFQNNLSHEMHLIHTQLRKNLCFHILQVAQHPAHYLTILYLQKVIQHTINSVEKRCCASAVKIIIFTNLQIFKINPKLYVIYQLNKNSSLSDVWSLRSFVIQVQFTFIILFPNNHSLHRLYFVTNNSFFPKNMLSIILCFIPLENVPSLLGYVSKSYLILKKRSLP